MKLIKLVTLACLVLAAHVSVKTQKIEITSDEMRKEIFSAYGYCKSQGWTLAEIIKQFPEFKVRVLQAEAEFQPIFGKSCDEVRGVVDEILGPNVDSFNAELKTKLANALDYSKLTRELSSNFVETVRGRAKGEIASPFKEILLAVNPAFRRDPSAEFNSGFTRKYRTADHPKAKGIDFEVKAPFSWKSREGNRPNIIQFFNAKNGYSDSSMSLMVLELPTVPGFKPTAKDFDDMFAARGLKDFVPAGGTFIEGKPIVLEGQKGGMFVYDIAAQRLDLKFKTRITSYVVHYKKRLIMIQFSTTGLESDAPVTIKEFNANRPLFQMIANSLVIMDKYKK